jgi:hypothetical protein
VGVKEPRKCHAMGEALFDRIRGNGNPTRLCALRAMYVAPERGIQARNILRSDARPRNQKITMGFLSRKRFPLWVVQSCSDCFSSLTLTVDHLHAAADIFSPHHHIMCRLSLIFTHHHSTSHCLSHTTVTRHCCLPKINELLTGAAHSPPLVMTTPVSSNCS